MVFETAFAGDGGRLKMMSEPLDEHRSAAVAVAGSVPVVVGQ